MDFKDYNTEFDEIVVKVLTAADINSSKGHQHEFNGVAKLNKWFLGQKTDIRTKFVQIDCNGNQIWTDTSILTWYNVREKTPGREEFRMYYHKSVIFTHFNANDLMVILFKLKSGIPEALMISVPLNSPASNNISYLLKIHKTTNLPPVSLKNNVNEDTIANIISLFEHFSSEIEQMKKQTIKDRSTQIRNKIDLKEITTNPDKCLAELFIAENNDDSETLSGYYEQLAIVLIRNGIFFDYIKEKGAVIGINLGIFDDKKYHLYTCINGFSDLSIDSNCENYCVILRNNPEIIENLVQNEINPIVLESHNDHSNGMTLLSFIQKMNTIQRGE